MSAVVALALPYLGVGNKQSLADASPRENRAGRVPGDAAGHPAV